MTGESGDPGIMGRRFRFMVRPDQYQPLDCQKSQAPQALP